MKKLILKTALITVGVVMILAVSVFGIVSFCAPASMMRFCESIGLKNISGDYAYQEYQNSRDLSYLAHAFEVAADNGSYAVAEERFEELYGEEESDARTAFAAFCEQQNTVSLPQGVPDFNYRSYLCGRAATVKYHLAVTDDEKEAVCAFAIYETGEEFLPESPLMSLAIEAIEKEDVPFCSLLLNQVKAETKFDEQNTHYLNLVKFLEEAVDEQ